MWEMRRFLLKLRRADPPVYRRLNRAARWLLTVRVPVPTAVRPIGRAVYAMHFALPRIFRRLYMLFYGEPLFRSRCEQFGVQCFVWKLPEVRGHTRIYVEDNVSLYGKLYITSGRTEDEPVLRLGAGAQLGHNVHIVVGQRVILESGVMIANNCLITDTETHPRDPGERRLSLGPVRGRDIQPVRIRRNAWIGSDCTILKGVTIGEGAIVGARSVVISDVPDGAIAMGNPARVTGSARYVKQSGHARKDI